MRGVRPPRPGRPLPGDYHAHYARTSTPRCAPPSPSPRSPPSRTHSPARPRSSAARRSISRRTSATWCSATTSRVRSARRSPTRRRRCTACSSGCTSRRTSRSSATSPTTSSDIKAGIPLLGGLSVAQSWMVLYDGGPPARHPRHVDRRDLDVAVHPGRRRRDPLRHHAIVRLRQGDELRRQRRPRRRRGARQGTSACA